MELSWQRARDSMTDELVVERCLMLSTKIKQGFSSLGGEFQPIDENLAPLCRLPFPSARCYEVQYEWSTCLLTYLQLGNTCSRRGAEEGNTRRSSNINPAHRVDLCYTV